MSETKNNAQEQKPKKSKIAIASLALSSIGVVFYLFSLILVSLDNILPIWVKSDLYIQIFGIFIGLAGWVAFVIALLGAVLGGIGLIWIRGRVDKLSGKTEAISGLVIGLVFSFYQMAMFIWVASSFWLGKD